MEGVSTSTAGFVAATGPGLALVSAGHGNRFGHPDPAAVARWEAGGAQVVGTPVGGALRVRLTADGITLSAERERRKRPWDATRPR